MSENRELAAIPATEVVGYSRIAGGDAERALARLRRLRSDLIDRAIVARHGRAANRAGDTSIIENRAAARPA